MTPSQTTKPRQRGEYAYDHRGRPEHQRHGRRRRPLEGIDKAELVQKECDGAKSDQPKVSSRYPERALATVGEYPKQDDRREIANRAVGERLPTVQEQVFRNSCIESPEQNRPDQHEVDRSQTAHSLTLEVVGLRSESQANRWRSTSLRTEGV